MSCCQHHLTRLCSIAAVGSLLAAAVGCGAEASLSVQFAVMDGDNPFVGLSKLEVTCYRDDTIQESRTVPWDGRRVELDPIRRAEGLEVVVTGLVADNSAQSQGMIDPHMPARGGRCCVTMCFCTKELFDGGGCTCGDPTCRDACGP
jgi:hypothetical protein